MQIYRWDFSPLSLDSPQPPFRHPDPTCIHTVDLWSIIQLVVVVVVVVVAIVVVQYHTLINQSINQSPPHLPNSRIRSPAHSYLNYPTPPPSPPKANYYLSRCRKTGLACLTLPVYAQHYTRVTLPKRLKTIPPPPPQPPPPLLIPDNKTTPPSPFFLLLPSLRLCSYCYAVL